MTNYRQKDTQVHRQRGIHAPQEEKKRRRVASLCLQKIFFKSNKKKILRNLKRYLPFLSVT